MTKLQFPFISQRFTRSSVTEVNLASEIMSNSFFGVSAEATLTIISYSASRVSDEPGKTTCSAIFSTDVSISSWEARATYESQTPGPGVGWVVGSGSSLSAGATGTFDVTYDELTYGDRTYTISVYQLS